MSIRDNAIDAWEQTEEGNRVASGRQALIDVIGSELVSALSHVDTSSLDDSLVVVFEDSEGEQIAARRTSGDVWEVLLVEDNNGWTKRAGPFESLADIGEWYVMSDNDVAPWEPNKNVVVGDQREYEGVVYSCLQSHKTQTGWEPPNTPALWEVSS